MVIKEYPIEISEEDKDYIKKKLKK